ncbi:MAG TPA: hypothetical protein PLI95_20385 [Polyangiaceae bacterium]|nr:hypothetical protein [Polyangiaceae bacterium]
MGDPGIGNGSSSAIGNCADLGTVSPSMWNQPGRWTTNRAAAGTTPASR